MTAQVEVEEASVAFGGVQAVRRCSLRAAAGAITGLIGPNGAGKTTLFNLVAGALRPDAGRIRLDGRDVTDLRPEQRYELGLARTFQIPHEFGDLTVLENLMVAPRRQPGERLWTAWSRPTRTRAAEAALRDAAQAALDFLKLAPLADQRAGALSGGQKKLLELGRVMMAEPRVVLLDEVAAGVNRALLADLADAIAALNRERGLTFLMIEHDVELIARLCDRVVVMAEGRVMTEGPPEAVRRDPAVIEAYFGGAPP